MTYSLRLTGLALSILLAACAAKPVYFSVGGADLAKTAEVAFVVNTDWRDNLSLIVWSVDRERVGLEAFSREYYAISPGRHVLWILAPMHMPVDPLFMASRPNRCFVFDVSLRAGRTYLLVPLEEGRRASLQDAGPQGQVFEGLLVDESWWNCHWDAPNP